MAQGTLKILATVAMESAPVQGASYAIKDKQGNVLYSGITNENGESEIHTLSAPDKELSLEPNPDIKPYAVYDVWIDKPNFTTINYTDVEIYDGIGSVLNVNMLPNDESAGEEEITYVTPPPTAQEPTYPQAQAAPLGELDETTSDTGVLSRQPRVLPSVIMPDYVTVHLGTPSNTSAPNVRVRFIDYVKNVTSSEIYPTWPTNSIIANVHCIVSFVLNRIYTEWYRARGYAYDITNSTTVDQYFVNGRQIYENISEIVDGIFNVYARRQGFQNPYFTEYCNGTTVTCKGLSQWGTVTLANRGMTPLQILHNYYPDDLQLVTAPSGNNIESYPGTSLSLGSNNTNVQRMQNQLNRIRVNYPAINTISNPNGYFGSDTQSAVRTFQRTFNLTQDGVVGRSTWNKISQIFVSVTKLAELGSEGERIGLSPTPPTVTIRQGSSGANVIHAQFILNYLSNFYPIIPSVIVDGVFGAGTTTAARTFQNRFGLTADGIIGPATWSKLYEIYRAAENTQPETIPPTTEVPAYPGYLLRQGSSGSAVSTLQGLLNNARKTYSAIPQLATDGIFGAQTAAAVRTFQLYSGLAVDGIVGPATWSALTALL